MSDVAALDKHACPACGAMANWNAAQRALVCPYCGAVSPVELAADGSVVKEHDLVAALRAVPDEKKGWEADRVSVQCQSCKAITLFEPGRVAQNCEFCGSPKIIPQSAVRAPIVPESVLPFVVAETKVREDLAVVRQPLVRAEPAEGRRAHRQGARSLHPLLDLRRAGRGALDR
jgi:predicted RNA-binding Zn-ribbon protein involved in translation (DUF1610 family)